MIFLKIEDRKNLPFNIDQINEHFPNDPDGDIKIIIGTRNYFLQKNILGKNSAYFGQLATIKGIGMVQIDEIQSDLNLQEKVLKVLYGFEEGFSIQMVEELHNVLNFFRAKDLKSFLIGQLKQRAQQQLHQEQNISEIFDLFQFSFDNQIVTLSTYYQELLKKQNLIKNWESNLQFFLALENKSMVNLISASYFYESESVSSSPQRENLVKDIRKQAFKIIECFSQKKKLSNQELLELQQVFETKIARVAEKEQLKIDSKKNMQELCKELRQLSESYKELNLKVDEMKKNEKKNNYIINNLTQKVKQLEKALTFTSKELELPLEDMLRKPNDMRKKLSKEKYMQRKIASGDKQFENLQKNSPIINNQNNQIKQNLNQNSPIQQQPKFFNRNRYDNNTQIQLREQPKEITREKQKFEYKVDYPEIEQNWDFN